MHSVVSEAWIALNSGLFRQNVIVLTFEVADNFLKPRQTSQRENGYQKRRHVRKLIIDIVAKPRGINNGKSNTYALLLEFYKFWFNREGYEKSSRFYLPTLTGLIRIPSSICAHSGLSETLWANTSDSQRVLTKVVRPVPEAPRGQHWGQWREAKGMRNAYINIPTTITVNWTPFLTLFPLRLPANDIFGVEGQLWNWTSLKENLLSTLKVRGGVTSFISISNVTWGF